VRAPGLRYARTETLAARKARAAWLFLAPTLATLALVGIWPLARTAWLSLTDARLGETAQAHFVGLDNYLLLIGDAEWWNAVWNTLVFTVFSVSIETVLGTVFALVMNAHFRGRALVRAAILVPWAIPLVVSGKMWAWMFNDLYGVVNAGLIGAGVLSEPVAWLADPDLAMAAIVAADVWKTTPFMALLILAALQMVPKDVYEAARLDGVSPVRVFFRITLPLIRPVLLVAVIFRSLDALRIFDLVYIMTSNSRQTATMSVFARRELVEFADVGYGSAASVLIFLIVGACTLVYLRAARLRPDEGAT
jgi:trehalose/maltose transport system permease protein